jgi:hypothetical protein
MATHQGGVDDWSGGNGEDTGGSQATRRIGGSQATRRIAQRRQQIGNVLCVDMRCVRRASFDFSFCRAGFAFGIAQIPRRTINVVA